MAAVRTRMLGRAAKAYRITSDAIPTSLPGTLVSAAPA